MATGTGDYAVNHEHNKTTLRILRKGDLVEFKRGRIYSHWGVYVGNGEVVHLAGEDDDGINNVQPKHLFTISGKHFNKAKVCKDLFWNIVGTDKAIKNNDKDGKLVPHSPEEIVQNALSKMGEVGYSLIFKNCEHFAKWCRYGLEKSDQVDNAVTGLAVGLAGALVLGVVHAIAKFWGGNRAEEEEEEETQQRSKRRQNAYLHPTSG